MVGSILSTSFLCIPLSHSAKYQSSACRTLSRRRSMSISTPRASRTEVEGSAEGNSRRLPAKQFTQMRRTALAFPSGPCGAAREREVVATTRPSMVTRSGQWSQLIIPVSLLMPSEVHAAASGRRMPSLRRSLSPLASRQTERSSTPARRPWTTSLSEKRPTAEPFRNRQPTESAKRVRRRRARR